MHEKKRRFRCGQCSKIYVSESCLRRHMKNECQTDLSFTCRRCQKSFYQRCHLERHMKLHQKTAKVQVRQPHEVNAVQAQNYNLFGTEEIDKLWKQIPSLSLTCNTQEKTKQEESNKEESTEEYECQKDPSFMHEKKRQFPCDKCSKKTVYFSEPCLRRHKKYQRRTDPSLTCRQCQKSFYLRCNLVRHMKLHQKTAEVQVRQPHEVTAVQAQNHNLFWTRK
ncbi:zinc finger protein 28-like [Trichogramma pretiosum]|uniref:zinc finger protein 28-like n=1 Tax=Trichogramma pretiosum TaxID=7493 RepID=UPI0006C98540|nr:zinc finger protein 28-like [Trichogramma pretiosum]